MPRRHLKALLHFTEHSHPVQKSSCTFSTAPSLLIQSRKSPLHCHAATVRRVPHHDYSCRGRLKYVTDLRGDGGRSRGLYQGTSSKSPVFCPGQARGLGAGGRVLGKALVSWTWEGDELQCGRKRGVHGPNRRSMGSTSQSSERLSTVCSSSQHTATATATVEPDSQCSTRNSQK